MPVPPTRTPNQRLQEFNDQAIAMIRLGMVIDVGLGAVSDPDRLILRLQRANEVLEATPTDAQSVGAISQHPELPQSYREFATLLLASSDPAEVFRSRAISHPNFRLANQAVSRAMLQPTLILLLAFLGMIFLCLHVLPPVQAHYEQFFQTPSGFTALLIQTRQWMPIWIIAAPIIALVVWLFFRIRGARLLLRAMPGNRRYQHWLSSSSRAAHLAAQTSAPSNQNSEFGKLAEQTEPNPLIDRIYKSEKLDNAAALDRLSVFYQDLAATYSQRVFGSFPGLIGLGVAGIAVLVYGLATFLPWVEVLFDLMRGREI